MRKHTKNTGNREKRLIAKQLQKLNDHLPKNKKTLQKLKEKENNYLKTKNGEKIRIDNEEIKYIKETLPRHLHSELKIPIYIESGKKYGKGNYKIKGKAETRLIQKILEKDTDIFKKEIILNRVELKKIRNKLKTTTKYMFMVDLSEISKKDEMGRTKKRRRS